MDSLTSSTEVCHSRGVQGASFISILANQTDLNEKVVRDGYWRASGSALVKKILLGEILSLR